MVDPTDVTNFNRSEWQLQEFLLFCVTVAGKTARIQAKLLEDFFNTVEIYRTSCGFWASTTYTEVKLFFLDDDDDLPMEQRDFYYTFKEITKSGLIADESPFSIIRFMIEQGVLGICLENTKLGQYNKLEKAFKQLVESDLNLRTCTVEELEQIHGIALKTSRFFVVHTRNNSDYAIIDVHILKYLRDHLNIEDAPKITPSNLKEYQRLEQIFVNHAKEHKCSVADLDLEIWKAYSEKRPFDISVVPTYA